MSIMYIASILFLQYFQLSARVERDVLITYTEERINNKLFKSRIDFENGTKKETYSIDGVTVPQEEYEEAILNAEKEEKRLERAAAHNSLLAIGDLHNKIQAKLLKSELLPKVKKLEADSKRLLDDRLKAYIVFGKDTFESQEDLDNFISEFIPEAYTIVNQDEKDIKKLLELDNQITEYTKTIQEMFVSTVQNAIDKSDDTKLLKDLLFIIN